MSKKILLLGDSCDDIYHFGSCSRLSQEAPVPIFQETHRETKGGMSTNVKNNLNSFGYNVTHLKNETRLEKHRLFDTKFNAHVLRYDVGENKTNDRLCLRDLQNLPKDIDALVISDYNKGFLSPMVIKNLCRQYEDIPIFSDSKKKDLSCFCNCYLKINEQEFELSSNILDNIDLIVTLGERGAKYNGETFSTSPREVFDVCGAGDVFLASLVYGVLEYNSLPKAIALANKAATLSVSKAQTYTLSPEDIETIKQ
jgi:bifunctional ADP-heptose synthase (sugar kinase/adenylyltransferase)